MGYMVSKVSKAFWDLISLSGGEALTKFAGLVAFAYLARVLEPGAYGAVETAASMLAAFSLVVDFGYGQVGAREVSQRRQCVSEYASLIPAARAVLAVLSSLLICAAVAHMGQRKQIIDLVSIYSLALLAVPWHLQWLLQGLDRMSLIPLGQMIRAAAFLMGVLIFVGTPGDLMHVGYVEVGASGAMAAYFLIMQRRLAIPIRMSFHIRRLVSLSRQAFAIGMSQMVWALSQYTPVILVAVLAGPLEAAWFGAVHRVVTAIAGFSMLYHFNFFPTASKRIKESHQSFMYLVEPSFRVTTWLGMLVALTVTLLSEDLCTFIYGGNFSQAAVPMAILIWSAPLMVIAGHAGWALIAGHKQRYLLYSQILGALATLLLAVLLIPSYGSIGGSISMVAGAAVVWWSTHYYATRWIGPLPFLTVAIKPFALGTGILILGHWYAGPPWHGAILGIVGYVLLSPVLERSIVSDIRRLIHIKGDGEIRPEDRSDHADAR